jgi:hypothetical protein
VPDGSCSSETFGENSAVTENIEHKPLAFVGLKTMPAIATLTCRCNDTARLLAAMLQGMERVVADDRCRRVVEDTDDAAIGAGFLFG